MDLLGCGVPKGTFDSRYTIVSEYTGSVTDNVKYS